jgi:hypothetical protein
VDLFVYEMDGLEEEPQQKDSDMDEWIKPKAKLDGRVQEITKDSSGDGFDFHYLPHQYSKR